MGQLIFHNRDIKVTRHEWKRIFGDSMTGDEEGAAVRDLEIRKQLKDLQKQLRHDPAFHLQAFRPRLKVPDELQDEKELMQFTALPEVITFGKYKGMKLIEVPADYLEWLIEQQLNSTVRYRAELDRRLTPDEKDNMQTYTVRLQSNYIVTATHIRNSLGVGFKVLSVETERDTVKEKIVGIKDAVKAIIKTGYRALARAHHPDMGGDVEVMADINKAKKELDEVIGDLYGEKLSSDKI